MFQRTLNPGISGATAYARSIPEIWDSNFYRCVSKAKEIAQVDLWFCGAPGFLVKYGTEAKLRAGMQESMPWTAKRSRMLSAASTRFRMSAWRITAGYPCPPPSWPAPKRRCSKSLPAILSNSANRQRREFEPLRAADVKKPTSGGLFSLLARPERFELPTTWFVARYSIQLSYGRV